MQVEELNYKGWTFDYNVYGRNEYTIQVDGDDIYFKSLKDVHKFIDEMEDNDGFSDEDI